MGSEQCVRCGIVDYTSNVYCRECQEKLKKRHKERNKATTASRQERKDKQFGKLFRVSK